jgi:hypothetical protein
MTNMLEQAQPHNPQSTPQTAAAPQPEASRSSQSSRDDKETSAPHGLAESADQALQSVGALYNAVDAIVSKSVRESPYVTLAAAAGVGFILGGGLRSPIGQVLVRVGVRAFGPPLVSAALHTAVERAGLTQER